MLKADEALIIAKKQYNDNFDGHSNKIIHSLTPIYQSHDTPIKIALYIHRGREVCLKRAISLIQIARNSIYLTITDFAFLEAFYVEIKKARARGVIDLKLLIEEKSLVDKKHKDIIMKFKELCEVKSRDQVFGTSIITDEGEDAFIILSQKFFQKLSYFGVVTDHIAFGGAALYYFNYLYKSAILIEL